MESCRAYMSYGGGVQSTAIAMLAINRDPRLLAVTGGVVPEMYLFADTGDERQATYAHVWEMARRIVESGATFLATYKGRLSDHIIHKALTGGSGTNTLPFFVLTRSGTAAPDRRGCTAAYKIHQLDRAAKDYFGVRIKRGHIGGYLEEPVVQWLGISADEVQRMKSTDEQWRSIEHPLIDMGWRRGDCVRYLDELGINAPRSSCVYCPFHGSTEWREVRTCQEDWELVLEVDQALEEGFACRGHIGGLDTRPYLTRHLKPIDQVDFGEDQLSLFEWECAGVCGV